jgi:ribose 5-phosphate isomerase B
MIIFIGSDHGGYELKNQLIEYLRTKSNIETIIDKGCMGMNSCDYPDYAKMVSNDVSANKTNTIGILICGTGIGMSIVANKFNGVRCALCNTVYCAEMAKKHNNANIIAMGSRIVDYDLAIQIIDTFMTSNFEGGRHKRRIDKIE